MPRLFYRAIVVLAFAAGLLAADAIEGKYLGDLSGNRLQSTIHGERKGNALAGTYQTKPLAGGAQVDEGEWKAAPAQ